MKKIFVWLMVMAMAISVAGCSAAPAEEAAEKTSLVLGTSADYPPFEFIVLDENGEQEYAGIDIAFAKKLAEDKGLDLEIVNMSFDNLMASLQKGEVDMVIAAIEANEERAQVADFSDDYYTDLPPMVLVKAENAELYTSLESFAGKSVGAQMGTSKAELVLSDMPDATLVTMSTVNDLVNNVVYGKCEAIVLDGAVAQQYANNDDGLEIAPVDLGEAYPYAVAVQKDDPLGLIESFNGTIAQVTSDGTMETWIEEAHTQSENAIE
jgi:polar amino acid transport system substrate-binding protein